MIARGEPWGEPTDRPADVVVTGADAELADACRHHPGARITFEPDGGSDLARAVGIRAGADRSPATSSPATSSPATYSVELPIDVLELDDGAVVVNAAVLGAPPRQIRWSTLGTGVTVKVDGRVVFDGRATTVVVANGQFLDGDDVVPRGHPGDGRVEVQVYALRRGERRAMRRRLADGTHVPHPRITQATGRVVLVRAPARVPLVADGRPRGAPEEVRLEVRPGALTLVL